MLKQTGVVFLCMSVLFYVCGCGTMKNVSMAEFEKDPHSQIKSVQLKDGRVLKFAAPNRADGSYDNGMFFGKLDSGKVASASAASVDSVRYWKSNSAGTIVLVAGIVAVAGALIWAATFELDFSWNSTGR